MDTSAPDTGGRPGGNPEGLAPQGYLALLLHAHLPFVRHPEHDVSLEENWLFEALTESYIRLFIVLEGLVTDGVDFRLSLSLTPTLASMLLDPLLTGRYLARLDRSIELARKEIVRTGGQPQFQALAHLYERLFIDVRRAFVEWYDGNLITAFKRFQDMGKIEILASAATHGYLPLLSVNRSAVRAQIRIGVEYYTQLFGCAPKGFWLPECGYYPGVDEVLAEHGIRYTVLETHGVTHASARPRYGVYAPLQCPSGVAVFGRDPDSSKQVWSSKEGYPGDYDYREFYRDIGFDLDLEYIRPYIQPGDIRVDTGFKYYRTTGPDREKEVYVPEWAEIKAERHAGHYLSGRISQVEHLARAMDRKPLILAPYDAELFGHWWWEGPTWIDYLFRKTAAEQKVVKLTTLSAYLEEYPENQVAQPSQSSWGNRGFSDVWLNSHNDWIYRHLHAAAEDMERIASGNHSPRRAIDQAARELLLAQSSDWAFMINSGEMMQYATARTRSHLLRFREIVRQIDAGELSEEWLSAAEKQDNIFPDMDVAVDYGLQSAGAATEKRQRVATRRRYQIPAKLRVAMISPEIAPYAKTGGLADMVASLAKALDELGHEVVLVMPGYRRAEEETMLAGRIPVCFIREGRYFNRDRFYDYADDARRFSFFARAALEKLSGLGHFDILHSHDWQSGLVNTFLKAQPELYPELFRVKTVFTIHNQGYQGLFPASDWPALNLDWRLFSIDYLEYYGKINFLKGAIMAADAITTVSPSYAQEIQTPEYGAGLEGVLRQRAGDLSGILNGADYSVWNPEVDLHIARNYGRLSLSGKRVCKRDLQTSLKLAPRPDTLLIGMVSRLVSQKGCDLLEPIMDQLLARDVQFVLLGTGDAHYEQFFRDIADRFRERVRVQIGFDEALAHRIEAGADVFLMPSRYEPSGLNQLYSLKYGTIPIVRATGGLKDSVGAHNGFVFEEYEPAALLAAIDRALALFPKKLQWERLMKSAMKCDFSWDKSAAAYIGLYRRLLMRN